MKMQKKISAEGPQWGRGQPLPMPTPLFTAYYLGDGGKLPPPKACGDFRLARRRENCSVQFTSPIKAKIPPRSLPPD